MSRINPGIIEIDGAGFEWTGVAYVNGWQIITSADTAALKILDKFNDVVIEGKSAITNERMISNPPFANPQRIENLKVDTWTNIERIIIYVDRFGS